MGEISRTPKVFLKSPRVSTSDYYESRTRTLSVIQPYRPLNVRVVGRTHILGTGIRGGTWRSPVSGHGFVGWIGVEGRPVSFPDSPWEPTT